MKRLSRMCGESKTIALEIEKSSSSDGGFNQYLCQTSSRIGATLGSGDHSLFRRFK